MVKERLKLTLEEVFYNLSDEYGEKFNSEDYPNGIPKEEFESLIMEYLPITAEVLCL